MGWSSGSRLFGALIESLQKNVPDDDDRKSIYQDMIEAFQDYDWDNLDECLGEDEVYDELYEELYPTEDDNDYFEDDVDVDVEDED
jgi:hypothetical protein